ncbi:MAG: hypothetical protein L6R38_005073 [Xanthoria sp. 2 TBL-2021]|nr:MAG: hypothetical protein L6R38_005073 [Xanthoria sp. 2 TBL-2021]
MIPETFISSYQRYKEDTNVFTTWLSQAARICGFKLPSLERNQAEPKPSNNSENKAPRLKGKARKEAKAASSTSNSQDAEAKPVLVSKYKLTTRNLIEQAEVVVNSKKANVQMPDSVLHVARRAIHARQRCSDWFRTTGSKDQASTESHAHFIAVLEQAMAILKPCYSNDLPGYDQRMEPNEKDSKQAEKSPQTFDDDLSNRFHMLKVHDTDSDVDLTATEVQASAKQTPTKSQTKSQVEREVWELVEEFSTDIAFVIFCFFEDLHRIQDFLKETWKKYKDGTLDLMTCAMTTNLALDLVRRAEEDIINQAPMLLGGPRSYEALSVLIFYAESFKNGKDPNKMLESDESLKITPFDEFIYLSTARILIKFEQISSFKIAYPQPVPSVRMSYLSRPDLLDLPQVKKWEEEDEFLSQLLMEMSLDDTVSKAMKEINRDRKAPAVDELTKGLYKLRREGEVSTWMIFAARILLDIRDIMGEDMSRGHQEQVAAGRAAFERLDMTVEGNGALTPKGLRWKGRDGAHVMSLWCMLQYYSINDPFPIMKQKWLAEKAHVVDSYQSFDQLPPEWQEEVKSRCQSKGIEPRPPPEMVGNMQQIGLRPIKHATDPNFLSANNPIASGTLMFNICLDMEHAGTALANHHQSIFAIAHLYNAARQTKTLNTSWPAMEEVMQLQITELFAGQLPQTPKDFQSRYALRLGISAQHFARNQRSSTTKKTPTLKATRKNGPQMSNTPASSILSEYINDQSPMARCIYKLESLIQATKAHDSKKLDKRIPTKRQITPLELLSQVRDWLPTTLPLMKIDYIALTRTCSSLLKKIHTAIESELGVEHHLMRDGDSSEAGYIIMALQILMEVNEMNLVQEEILKSRGSDRVEGSPQLDVCARVIREHLGGALSGS